MQFTPVAPPPLRPPVVSLVTSGRDALAAGEDVGDRWVDGFSFQPELNVDPDLLAACGGTSTAGATPDQPTVETVPWHAQVQDVCKSTFGYRGRDYVQRAVTALAAATPKAVEFEFWTGETAQAAGWPNLYLTNGTATDVTPTPGTAVTLDEGVALLEQALADCGSGARGMIHCQPLATPSTAIVRREGATLLTLRDTLVVPGVGYPGTGPTGTAPAAGKTWMYATGMVDVRLGPIQVYGRVGQGSGGWVDVDNGGQAVGFDPERFAPALLDRSTNTLTVPATRPVAAAWDGVCLFAVLVNVPSAP